MRLYQRLLLTAGCVAFPLAAAAQSIPVVEVAAPGINCLASPDCRITVSDSVGVLGEGSRSELGFLQSRSAVAQDDAPAAGHIMMQYRLNLAGAHARRGGPCITRVDLRSAPPESPLDLDGDGHGEVGVFAVTQGAIGTVVPSSVSYDDGVVSIEFADGVCPPGSREEAEDGESSVFFGWFVRSEPQSSVSRVVFADETKLQVAARSAAPVSGPAQGKLIDLNVNDADATACVAGTTNSGAFKNDTALDAEILALTDPHGEKVFWELGFFAPSSTVRCDPSPATGFTIAFRCANGLSIKLPAGATETAAVSSTAPVTISAPPGSAPGAAIFSLRATLDGTGNPSCQNFYAVRILQP